MMKSDIGECSYVLYHKVWGKTPVGNRLRSKKWWEDRRETLINSPTVVVDPKDNTNPGIYDQDGTPILHPIPFEIEMGWTEETSLYWLGWLQTAFQKIISM